MDAEILGNIWKVVKLERNLEAIRIGEKGDDHHEAKGHQMAPREEMCKRLGFHRRL